MSRGLSSTLIAELESGSIYPFTMVEFYFDSATMRFITGHSDITWNGNLYSSSANLIQFGDITETQQLQISSMSIVVSSVTQTILALALAEPMTNRIVTLRRGLRSLSTYELVEDPTLMYSGRIKSFSVSETPGESSQLTFETGSVLSDFMRTAGRRNNQQDQEAFLTLIGDSTIDLGFEFSHQLQTDLKWGKA